MSPVLCFKIDGVEKMEGHGSFINMDKLVTITSQRQNAYEDFFFKKSEGYAEMYYRHLDT